MYKHILLSKVTLNLHMHANTHVYSHNLNSSITISNGTPMANIGGNYEAAVTFVISQVAAVAQLPVLGDWCL